MRINWTLFGAGLTGGSFNIIEPAQRLARRGHDVTVTSIGRAKDMAWFSSHEKPLFKTIFSPVVGSIAYRVYRKILNRTLLHPFPDVEIRDLVRVMPDCDINIATSDKAASAVYRSGKGRGWYYAQHYDSLFVPRAEALRHDESYYLPLRKLAVSTWLKNAVESRLAVPFAGVITAGIDGMLFNAAAGEKKSGTIRIISLGRNVAWKGFAELREAMRIILVKYPHVEWWVYSSRDTPQPTADAPFTLFKSPYGKELARLYASCDIAVNPSWHEGFAQPALEAMACGAAVITTSIGAEDFIEAEENCIVVPPKSSANIVSAIERLIGDAALRIRITEKGIKTAERFHWDRIIDRWEDMLKI